MSESASKMELKTTGPDIPNDQLHALHPDVLLRQATINIGTIGHVAHGKSTVVQALSGKKTLRYRMELERNITVKLGYANAKIYQCPNCPRPACFSSYPSTQAALPPCAHCGAPCTLVRHVSFVDCPGHDLLMSTMISGAAVMDACLLLIAGNEACPQPQTSEHLAAVEILNLQHIIVLQNKIDLVTQDAARSQYGDIQTFMRRFASGPAKEAPIVPISAQLRYGTDAVCDHIVHSIPVPERDFVSPARLTIIRSFDINLPGATVDQLEGGVLGGSLVHGTLRINDQIEIRPGIVEPAGKKFVYRPILTTVRSLFAEENRLGVAIPGGLIGVGTNIDPSLTRQDRLVGNVAGAVGSLPPVYASIDVSYVLLTCLLGVRSAGSDNTVADLAENEYLYVNIGSLSCGACVTSMTPATPNSPATARFSLPVPVCASVGEKIAVSRRIDKHWRLIGWASLLAGEEADRA